VGLLMIIVQVVLLIKYLDMKMNRSMDFTNANVKLVNTLMDLSVLYVKTHNVKIVEDLEKLVKIAVYMD
jgi:hypothetical protein